MKDQFFPILALAAISTFTSLTSAQELSWENDFVDAATPIRATERLLPMPNGGVVVMTRVALTINSPWRTRVSSYDENGDLLWTRYFRDAEVAAQFIDLDGPGFDAVVDPQGDLYVMARPINSAASTAVTRIAPDGTNVWSTVMSGPDQYRGNGIALAPNGNVVLVGSYLPPTEFPQVQVDAIDPAGNIVWTWDDFGSASGNIGGIDARGIRVAPSGDILIFGASDAFPFNFSPRVAVIDSAGNPLWGSSTILSTNQGSDAVLDAEPSAQGRWILLTDTLASDGFRTRSAITSFSASGGLEFTAGVSDDSIVSDIAVTSAGEIFYAATLPSSTGVGRRLALGRMSAAGSIIDSYVPSVVLNQSPSLDTFGDAVWLDGDEAYLVGTGDVGSNNALGAFIAAYQQTGTELWSQARTQTSNGPSTDLGSVDVATDPLGNVFWLASADRPGNGKSTSVVKLVSGGEQGVNYCSPAVPNSTGQPATMAAIGASDPAVNNLTLRTTGLPIGAFSLMLASQDQGLVPGAGGGQGTLCLGGAIGRYVGFGQVRTADGAGAVSLQLDLQSIPQPTGFVPGLVGEVWNFQTWFRDANPTATSNFSDGVSVQLQ